MAFDRDAPLLIVLAVTFTAAVFLAAAEAALLRIPPVRVASLGADGSRRGRRLVQLLDHLPRVLAAILLGALLTQIGAATVTGILADRWFGSLGVTLASIVLTVVLFIYGEAIPKTYAVRHADRVALTLAPVIAALELVLRPVVSVLVWLADLQAPGRGVETAPTVTEDELRRLAAHAAVEGEITKTDLALIERAFRFGDRRVDDVMVPRPDIVAVSRTVSAAEAMDVALEAGHRRVPVYDKTIEDITGLVRLRDLVQVPPERRAQVEAGAIAESPLVVPESKRIFALLTEMQETKTHLAVVVDEFGGTAGIVTLEDIAEELLGTLSEEAAGEPVVSLAPGRWSVDAGLPVEDLEVITGARPPDGDWNTVAGLVLGLAGHVPALGQVVETKALSLRVAGLRRRRITRVEVTLR